MHSLPPPGHRPITSTASSVQRTDADPRVQPRPQGHVMTIGGTAALGKVGASLADRLELSERGLDQCPNIRELRALCFALPAVRLVPLDTAWSTRQKRTYALPDGFARGVDLDGRRSTLVVPRC